MSLNPRLIEVVAADLEAIASQLGGPNEALANRIKIFVNLLRHSEEADPVGRHKSAADQLWTSTQENPKTKLTTHPPNKLECLSAADQFWTGAHKALDRSVADQFWTDTSNKTIQSHQTKQMLCSKPTNPLPINRSRTEKRTAPSHQIPTASANTNHGQIRSKIPVLTTRLSRTVPLKVKNLQLSTPKRRTSELKIDTKPKRGVNKKIVSRFGASAPIGVLELNVSKKSREPIKLRIKATERKGKKTLYTSTLVRTEEADSLGTDSTQNKVQLNKNLDSETRSNYYKSLESEKTFSSLQKIPDFNVGKKMINPSDLSRLKRMTTLSLGEPEEYLKLHEVIENSEQLQNGTLNIEKITCNRAGKATIICENELHKELLKELLEDNNFHPKDTKIKDNSFALFGIPKTKKSEDVIKELTRRDKRFKTAEFKMRERFPINTSKDAITFSCCESLTAKITSKPHTFLGTNRHKISKFADLVQCYKCAKFGHTATKCDSKKICCPNCAQAHTLDNCTTNFTPKCGNCSMVKVGHSNHSSWDVRCPYRLLWIRKQKECLERTLL